MSILLEQTHFISLKFLRQQKSSRGRVREPEE
nr:MAG TPA: hypothetical protein [Caudoviricetes sp.]DAO53674.1 MAG TPA: hypothetical protein [Caudoviricetes sp.]